MAGVIRRPRATFEALKITPRAGAVLLATFAVTALLSAALLETSVGQLALLDQWERTAVAFGQDLSEAQYAAMRAASENGALYGIATAFARGPLLSLVIAGLLYAGFRLAGAGGTFTQVLSVVAHAGVILMLRDVIATPIIYARETLANPATFGLFFTVLDEASPIARFLGVLDLFVVWWIVVLAIGMSVLYGRPARRLAVIFAGVYVLLAVVVTVVMMVTGGTA
jgi:hypothetical protein